MGDSKEEDNGSLLMAPWNDLSRPLASLHWSRLNFLRNCWWIAVKFGFATLHAQTKHDTAYEARVALTLNHEVNVWGWGEIVLDP